MRKQIRKSFFLSAHMWWRLIMTYNTSESTPMYGWEERQGWEMPQRKKGEGQREKRVEKKGAVVETILRVDERKREHANIQSECARRRKGENPQKRVFFITASVRPQQSCHTHGDLSWRCVILVLKPQNYHTHTHVEMKAQRIRT